MKAALIQSMVMAYMLELHQGRTDVTLLVHLLETLGTNPGVYCKAGISCLLSQ